jgi:alkanesulfonate monooxygenase SsuD/methylene tetrahydromethanopterin reductase-like flavin-dependent oxidoreductase (luciferase family)
MADEAGMSFIGARDIMNRNYECYVLMTMLAMTTSRARFMSTVTNTRHPAVAAASWASLQDLSDGRATRPPWASTACPGTASSPDGGPS